MEQASSVVLEGVVATDPKTIAEDLPEQASTTLAAGEGTKGLRLYDWARIRLPWTADAGFERWLMIRRSRKEPQKRAYYLVFAPEATTFAELAAAAFLAKLAADLKRAVWSKPNETSPKPPIAA